MNRFRSFSLLIAIGLLSWITLLGATPLPTGNRVATSAAAQSQPNQQPPSQQPPQSQAPGTSEQQPPQQQQQGQMFTGTMKMNAGEYVFLDDASKATYKLDHQDQLSKYKLDGKKVQIVGALETASNTIHITKIAVLS